jgi:hypothetical protein
MGIDRQVKAATAIIPIMINTSPLISIGNRVLGESPGAVLNCRLFSLFCAIVGSISLPTSSAVWFICFVLGVDSSPESLTSREKCTMMACYPEL